MKRRNFMILGLALFTLAGRVDAADADPAGTWKWSVTNPTNNQTREFSVTLKNADGKLSGNVTAGNGKGVDIENATFKDGQVSFSVTRERNDQKVTTKYTGKVEGDTITGTFENARPNGKAQSRDWVAKRDKAS